MSFKKRMLLGLPIAIAFYFIILSFMWAVNVEDSYFQKLPEALVTFGTLMLAFAAFWSIKSRNEQEQQRRKDEAEKENRDRNERWLNEIIQWAADTVTSTSLSDIRLISLKGKELAGGLHSAIYPLKSKGQYIKHLSAAFDSSLENAVQKTCSGIQLCISYLQKAIVTEQSKFEEEVKKAIEQEVSLRKLANKVIDEASRIKTKDISRQINDESISSKDKSTSNDEPTHKDIMEYLKKYSREGIYFSAYVFGSSLIIIAISLLAGKYVLVDEWSYVVFCILMVSGGTALVVFAWSRLRRLKK